MSLIQSIRTSSKALTRCLSLVVYTYFSSMTIGFSQELGTENIRFLEYSGNWMQLLLVYALPFLCVLFWFVFRYPKLMQKILRNRNEGSLEAFNGMFIEVQYSYFGAEHSAFLRAINPYSVEIITEQPLKDGDEFILKSQHKATPSLHTACKYRVTKAKFDKDCYQVTATKKS